MRKVGLLEGLDPPDVDGARRWYTAAAETGDADGMFNLGLLLAGWIPRMWTAPGTGGIRRPRPATLTLR